MSAANTDKLRKSKSNFTTTLSSSITDSDTTIPLSSATGLPTDTAVTLTIDRVDANGTALATTERVIGVISGNNLTNAVRANDGTTAQAHSAGAVVECVWDADSLNDMIDAVLVNHDQAGGHKADSIDAITEIASALKSGSDTTLVTGTAGTDGNLSKWNADGDLVDGPIATLQGIFDAGQSITIADTDNQTLTITQNDTTNNPDAVNIVNAGTGTGLKISQNGVLGAGDHGLYVYSNGVQTAEELAHIQQDNASSDKTALLVSNDGTGAGVFIDQNGAGWSLDIDSEVTDGGGVIRVQVAGTSPSPFQVSRKDTVNGNVVLLLGGSYLWVDATGDLRIKTSAPGSDTDGVVVGTQS